MQRPAHAAAARRAGRPQDDAVDAPAPLEARAEATAASGSGSGSAQPAAEPAADAAAQPHKRPRTKNVALRDVIDRLTEVLGSTQIQADSLAAARHELATRAAVAEAMTHTAEALLRLGQLLRGVDPAGGQPGGRSAPQTANPRLERRLAELIGQLRRSRRTGGAAQAGGPLPDFAPRWSPEAAAELHDREGRPPVGLEWLRHHLRQFRLRTGPLISRVRERAPDAAECRRSLEEARGALASCLALALVVRAPGQASPVEAWLRLTAAAAAGRRHPWSRGAAGAAARGDCWL